MSGRMFRRTIHVVVLPAVVATVCGAVAAQDPDIVARVDRKTVYQGESLLCEVTVSNVEAPTAPSLDALNETFQVESLGQSTQSQQSISVVGNEISRVVNESTVFRFRLTPLQTGTLIIPALSVSVDGSEITSQEISIRVVEPAQQDIVLMELSSDRERVYPTQPFTVQLKIAVRKLPGDLSDRNPLSVQQDDPVRLTASWLTDESLPAGLEPKISWRESLEPLVSTTRRGGMRINNIGQQSVSMFFGGGHTTFLPKYADVSYPDLQGEPAEYIEFTIERQFVPMQSGSFHFSPARMKGVFATEFTTRLQGEEIYALSNDLTVMCRDVPLEGRPESFSGGIGAFQVDAQLAPTDATVGEPVTLSMKVMGEGTIADLRPPDIESIDGVAEQFRTYEVTEKTTEDGKVFTWSLRPLSDRVREFPAIDYAYFDVNAEEYVTVSTEPIPVSVRAASTLSSSDIVAPQPSRGGSGGGLEVNEAGLFANHTALSGLRNDRVATAKWIMLWCSMIVGYLIVSFEIRRRQRLSADPGILRRRNAQKRASEALNMVASAAGNDANVSAEVLSRIVAGLISDFCGAPETGMTPADARLALESVGVDADLCNRTVGFMEECDAARYGSDPVDSSQLVTSCRQLVSELGQELRGKC